MTHAASYSNKRMELDEKGHNTRRSKSRKLDAPSECARKVF